MRRQQVLRVFTCLFDPGTDPDSPWQVIVAEHADEVISGVFVTVGFSAGTNLTGCLRTLGVNENVFLFGS
jgi:hypothetical protein